MGITLIHYGILFALQHNLYGSYTYTYPVYKQADPVLS
jgi:hypothetical protein